MVDKIQDKMIKGKYSLQPSGRLDIKLYSASEVEIHLKTLGFEEKLVTKHIHGVGFNAAVKEIDGRLCIVKPEEQRVLTTTPKFTVVSNKDQSVSLRRVGGDIYQIQVEMSNARKFLLNYPTTLEPVAIDVILSELGFEPILPTAYRPTYLNRMAKLNLQISAQTTKFLQAAEEEDIALQGFQDKRKIRELEWQVLQEFVSQQKIIEAALQESVKKLNAEIPEQIRQQFPFLLIDKDKAV